MTEIGIGSFHGKGSIGFLQDQLSSYDTFKLIILNLHFYDNTEGGEFLRWN